MFCQWFRSKWIESNWLVFPQFYGGYLIGLLSVSIQAPPESLYWYIYNIYIYMCICIYGFRVWIYIYIYNVYNMYRCGVSSRFFGGPHSPVPDLHLAPARSKPSLPRTFWMKNVQRSRYVMEGISETFESFTNLRIWLAFQFNVHFGSIKLKRQGPHPHRCNQALRSQSAECQVGRSGQGKFGRKSNLDNALFTSLHCQDNNPNIRTWDMELKVTCKILCQ